MWTFGDKAAMQNGPWTCLECVRASGTTDSPLRHQNKDEDERTPKSELYFKRNLKRDTGHQNIVTKLLEQKRIRFCAQFVTV